MLQHNFVCSSCGKAKEHISDITTGYARKGEDKICFDCCALYDKFLMRENGAIHLYLTYDKDGKVSYVSNWPSTLKISIYNVKIGRHNMAGKRYDVWFMFEGTKWHGITYGDNTQICHCKRTKQKA